MALNRFGWILLNSEFIYTPANPKYGHNYFFHNFAKYHRKHSNGEFGGIHVICTSKQGEDPTYAGFGLKKTETTPNEIHQILVDAFNEDPIPFTDFLQKEKIPPEELELEAKNKSEKLTLAEFEHIKKNHPEIPLGFSPQQNIWLSARKIQAVLSKHLESDL